MTDYERIGRFIYGFQRICGSVEGLTGAGLPASASPELVARATVLAQRYNLIVKDFAAASDEDFASTLEEAAAVQSLIDKAGPSHGI